MTRLENLFAISKSPKGYTNGKTTPEYHLSWESLDQDYVSGVSVPLPQLVERNRDQLRRKYVDSLVAQRLHFSQNAHDLFFAFGSSKVPVWDLLIPTDFIFGQPSYAFDVMRLMAAMEFVSDVDKGRFVFAGFPAHAVEAMREWVRGEIASSSQYLNWHVDNPTLPESRSRSSRFTNRNLLWRPQRSIASLNRLLKHVSVGKRSHLEARESVDVVVIDYWAHIQCSENPPGGASMGLWGPLPRLLQDRGLSVQWIHRYVPTEQFPTLSDAHAGLDCALEQAPQQEHDLVTVFPRLVDLPQLTARVALYYLKLKLALRRLARPGSVEAHDPLTVWIPVILHHARRLSRVVRLAELAIWDSAVKRHLQQVRTARSGMFLLEGQAWERVLISQWRNQFPDAPLACVLNSTFRFWDLRPAAMLSTLFRTQNPPKMIHILTNGSWSHEQFQQIGFCETVLRDVEYLRDWKPSDATLPAVDPQFPEGEFVLVMGEYDAYEVARQVNWIKKAKLKMPELTIAFRPHPASAAPIPRIGQAGPDMISTGQLPASMEGAGAILCGHYSGSLLEVLRYAKVPIAVMAPTGTLSGLPLPSPDGLAVLSSDIDFVRFCETFGRINQTPLEIPDTFVWHSADLERWRAYLSEVLMPGSD